MIPPPAGGGASIIVAGNTQAYVATVRRLAVPPLKTQLWRSAIGGRRQVVRMIPPPAGLRRFEALRPLTAKRSLLRLLPFWNSDRPSPHHLSQPPKAALRNAQGPSGPQQVVRSAHQQVVG